MKYNLLNRNYQPFQLHLTPLYLDTCKIIPSRKSRRSSLKRQFFTKRNGLLTEQHMHHRDARGSTRAIKVKIRL